jgi:hypothetical protein
MVLIVLNMLNGFEDQTTQKKISTLYCMVLNFIHIFALHYSG